MSRDDDEGANDDGELFRRVASGVRPIDGKERVPPSKPRPRAKARFRREDDAQVLEESLAAHIDEIETASGEALRFARPSVGKRTMRRLARGNYAVQSEIDLHGMTAEEARGELRDFLESAVRRGHTCVRVVHGKGLGSGQRGPVMKRKVNAWLRRWDAVLAFTSTPQVDGGTGAVYVLLRGR